MRRVAVTGISGYLGSLLLRKLEAHPETEAVIGMDAVPPRASTPKLRFLLRDVAQPLDDLFARERVDAAVHLAFILKPVRGEAGARRVNVAGTKHFIQACQGSGLQHVLYLSSTAAYGAHPDNPVPLTEESSLRPNLRFQYSRDKAETDRMFQSFALAHPEVAVTVLRSCVVLGPGGAGSIGSKLFRSFMLRVAGYDPPVQYLHEEDLVAVLAMALERQLRGVLNVAGDGLLQYTEVARLAQRPMVAVPKGLLATFLDLTWALRLQSQSTSEGLDFITYPWVASTAKLEQQTGFFCRYSSEDAVRAYVQALSK